MNLNTNTLDAASLRAIQTRAHWGAHDYTAAWRADPRPHRDAAHALQHVTKALGKLCTACRASDVRTAGKALADCVICLVRYGSVIPGGAIDVADAWIYGAEKRCTMEESSVRGDLDIALGLLASALDDLDHEDTYDRGVARAALGDALRCVAWLGYEFDLVEEVRARLEGKGIGASGAGSVA